MILFFRKAGRLIANFLPKWCYPILKGPLKGKKIFLGSLGGPGNGASVYLDLVEQPQTIEFLKNVSNGNIVFDVGANVGYYTLLASLKIGTEGRVYSFEPVVRNLSYLYQHIKRNKIKNAFILPWACSNTTNIELFSFGPDSAQGHIIEPTINSYLDPNSYTFAHTTTLDTFSKSFNLIPKVIKIDVEGAEMLVLEGAKELLAKFKPKIFLSIHTNELEISCLNYLREFDYEFKLLDEKERPSVEYLCT